MKNLNNILASISDFIQKNPMFVFFLVLLWLVRSWLRKLFPSRTEPILPQGAKDYEVKQKEVSGAGISEAEATTKAEQLFQAMNVLSGTDEEVIYNTLRGISKADYNMIYNAFGLRYYNTVLGEGSPAWLGSLFDLNMWLVHELTVKELAELKQLNPQLPL
ncbi:hypothetical protein CAPN001_08510 [Capnocytophaga stomatis]|uniref:hypothetical protein n=1 Tax=Capnocytophaga stomatis TaxID=1848904 RepID=UPI001950C54A|nr:hypothetical protein [Capnocytophaga stomatis]GIJ93010.1 hypothetical protein CAPN002_02280 [Capnocytophaga stomatis]GIJ96282.1 hypothetical protein CAPN001_08510 [Capnocytophaga stomatis]